MQTESNDTYIAKEHQSATEASDAASTIVKEAIVFMKDTDNTSDSLTRKEDNQKVTLIEHSFFRKYKVNRLKPL